MIPGNLGLLVVAWISGLSRGQWAVQGSQGWELKAEAEFFGYPRNLTGNGGLPLQSVRKSPVTQSSQHEEEANMAANVQMWFYRLKYWILSILMLFLDLDEHQKVSKYFFLHLTGRWAVPWGICQAFGSRLSLELDSLLGV